MIYVSSSCIKTNSLETAVRTLVAEGYKNIELSGGTKYDDKALNQLKTLKQELDINFLLHNYFPTPKEAFVLNLAALDGQTSGLSLENIKKSIDWSVALGASKFAFHAGFLMNIPLNQIGKKIDKVELFNEADSYQQFAKNLEKIAEYNDQRIDLYIENNVLSNLNYQSFDQTNPFFFTNSKDLKKINLTKSYTILLDVAHLKVSCNSLSLNFEEELQQLFNKTDYIHVSDNNGLVDSNKGLNEDSSLYSTLKKVWKPGKTVTIEVYSGLKDIERTYRLLEKINNKND